MKRRIAAGVLAAALTAAAALVGQWEPAPGDARLVAYQDVGGVWTICDGHTRGVRAGQRVTPEQCDAWRDEDLREANAIVDRCITAPMNPHQRGAFISFAFNVGAGAKGIKDGLCQLKSGAMPYVRRMANAGRWIDACNGLLEWTKAGGEFYRGLLSRRRDERALCLRPWFGNVIAGSAISTNNAVQRG
jgi:lysozyme